MRSLAEIGREIDATQDRLAKLRQERAETIVARREAIIKAFDDGASRAQIVATFDIDYGALATLLHKEGRSYRQRRGADLGPAQRADYKRLLRHGVSSRSARAIAQTVTT